jgi:hypothetical protein
MEIDEKQVSTPSGTTSVLEQKKNVQIGRISAELRVTHVLSGLAGRVTGRVPGILYCKLGWTSVQCFIIKKCSNAL